MQYELIRLKNELGITFIYVTHDQEEALTMSDTIVVMNQGYIQQIGTPEKIYNEPENAFVADFIGESNINIRHHGERPPGEDPGGSVPLRGRRLRAEHPCGRGDPAGGISTC